ncbi:hypothetical protein GCM10011352_34950 [Marinobacterium zhoushanense]|uniref:Uncharacterized protein n=1 Tax=Marinobacterium zhoushanense TaxID=1679163 RepID=A0ABQ1KTH2_9GAMM|nr:hypothetical protein [Marinobacterium zhoushanense]GGC05769.1 hypothetical protein GCM10011352_34950 [Marinobacterium zhoushanense]
MRILKGILSTIGILFLGIICFVVYLSYSSSHFLKENREFINQFSYDLSENWRASDVHSRLSNEFIQSLDTPAGQFSFNQLKALGSLEDASDFELSNYYSGTDGKTAVVTFKATFENAKGVATVTVVEREGKVLIQGFHFSAPDGIRPTSTKHEA